MEASMIYPATAKWSQTNADLLQLAMEAKHRRTRERWLALYMIASGQRNATQWAKEIGRTDDTVLSWVHRYNDQGPEGIGYRRTGGRVPLFRESR
jgi:transposase